MGNCCPGGGGSSGSNEAVQSSRNLNSKEKKALKWLLDNSIIESEADVYKTDFSDGSMPPLHSQSRKVGHAAG